MNKQASILIVDDDIVNISTVKQFIVNAGYTALTADSGPQALEMLAATSVDLILLDVMMPEMNGFETCLRLKQNPASAEIPIIFLTALTDSASLTTGFEVGGVDYISKPFQRAELLAKIENHITLSVLRKMQASLISEMQARNINLESKNIHLENIHDMLPNILLNQVISIEKVCLQLSEDLSGFPAHQDKLTQVLGYIDQMKVTMEALYMLTVNALPEIVE